jgi:hypothetical protein
MPCTEGRLARFLKWKINRPSSVTADDYEVQGLTSGVGLFFVLLHFFPLVEVRCRLPEAFFGRSPVSGDRKKTQANGTSFQLG